MAYIIPGANEELRLLFDSSVELPSTDSIVVSIRAGNYSVDKTGSDLGIETAEEGIILGVKITQEESLRMRDNSKGRIQVNYLIPSAGEEPKRIPTYIATFDIGEQIYRKVME